MGSLINRQTLSPGFYGRTSIAYLVTLVRQKTLNSLGLIFMMFIFPNFCVFLSLVKSYSDKGPNFYVTGYLKSTMMYLENCAMDSLGNIFRINLFHNCGDLMRLWDNKNKETLVNDNFLFHSQTQTTVKWNVTLSKTKDENKGNTSNAYCHILTVLSEWQWGKTH